MSPANKHEIHFNRMNCCHCGIFSSLSFWIVNYAVDLSFYDFFFHVIPVFVKLISIIWILFMQRTAFCETLTTFFLPLLKTISSVASQTVNYGNYLYHHKLNMNIVDTNISVELFSITMSMFSISIDPIIGNTPESFLVFSLFQFQAIKSVFEFISRFFMITVETHSIIYYCEIPLVLIKQSCEWILEIPEIKKKLELRKNAFR